MRVLIDSTRRGLRCCVHPQALDLLHDELTVVELTADSRAATTTLIDECEVLLKMAAVTKCSACLLNGFQSNDTLETVRDKVAAEIKELRVWAVKEAEVLHPLLMTRVRAALALKPG